MNQTPSTTPSDESTATTSAPQLTVSIDKEKPSLLPEERKTIIIFDWDDTLLSSSFLSGKGYRLDSELVRGKGDELDLQLQQLEQSVITLLTTALSYGEVHIITNAETGR